MSIERTYRLPLRVVRMRGKAGRTALDMALLINCFRDYFSALTRARQDANPAIFCRFGLFVVESGYCSDGITLVESGRRCLRRCYRSKASHCARRR